MSILTDTEIAALTKIMQLKFAPTIEGQYFELSVSEGVDGVYAQVVLRNADRSFYYPVELRAQVPTGNGAPTKRDIAMALLDFSDAYFEDYLQGERDTYLPIDWCSYQFGEVDLQARGQVLNAKLEEEAARLLGVEV